MSKKLFKKIIEKASKPVPEEADKQLHPESYNGSKTRPRKSVGTSEKQNGKSRSQNASTETKNPRSN